MKHVLAALAVMATFACKGRPSPYDRLCSVYEHNELVSNDDSAAMMQLYQRVERELPEIMPIYDVVMKNEIGFRYSVLVDYARGEGKQPPTWECEALRRRWPPRTD